MRTIAEKEVHREISLHATHGGNRWRFTMRDTVSCTSAGAGAHRASLGTSGTAGGWKPGRGPSAFFLEHLSRRSAPRPAIPASPDARSRKPPLARTLCGKRPAFSRARASPDRASGVVEAGSGALAAGRWRRAGRGWRDRYLQKNSHGPLPRSIPLPFPTRPHTRGTTPARRRALTPFHCIAGHLAPGERDRSLQPNPR